ncbi:cupin domain-containing protein [Mycolicibacterium hodleri]|uniref:Cupin domain-containing protein n=1 Tax=Mycolicibacterium hodleri TaxID=49897 RepID=A0A502EJY5_9MYCO|nr:cupin domain-containing protein [Mycolicibacterium hodleri]TPG37282.1 cupin domain-containing protein [Mycolicibacterium hodleri]
MDHDPAHDAFVAQHPHWDNGWAMTAADAPAFWNVGTYWRLLSTDATTSGRSTTFEELCPPGVVAPPHVHNEEEEAFFVLEGDLTFLLDDEEIFAPPGTYVYIAPGTLHGFRCDSEVGRVFNTLIPGGFDHGISENGTPAPQVAMPPPGVSALSVWRELDQHRPRPPWHNSPDPKWQIRAVDGRPTTSRNT